MPKAIEQITTNRRRLLSGLALAPLAALPVPAHAVEGANDAELTALSARFVALERRISAIGHAGYTLEEEPAIEAAVAPLADEQDALAERMQAISVSGIAGIQAKARALVAWAPDLVSEPHLTFGEGTIPDLVASILRDLTGGRV